MAQNLIRRVARPETFQRCSGCHVSATTPKILQASPIASKVRSQATIATPLGNFENGYLRNEDNHTRAFFQSWRQGQTELKEDKTESPFAEASTYTESGLKGRDESSAEDPYWQKIPRWKDVSETQWSSYKWHLNNGILGKDVLKVFMGEALPAEFPAMNKASTMSKVISRDAFIEDFLAGVKKASMAIRLTPHILSVIDWRDPYNDPIRKQYIPLASTMRDDHPMCKNDSLEEQNNTVVKGLIHRYPDKVLFLANSYCPLYCRFCTRAYQIGKSTDTISKKPLIAHEKRWDGMFDAIMMLPVVNDATVSGGDTFMLEPGQLYYIGKKLLDIPHIKRIRIASKGLAVSPSRFLDPNDQWSTSLIALTEYGRSKGKSVALHTHFNHPNEITWVTRKAALHLFQAGVTVRNQTVLLKGVNDTKAVMEKLIRTLADNNIYPYYVYQADMVPGVEDLRTPLSTLIDLETEIRGSIGGMMMPNFVVDLPGGGGKRTGTSHISYDRKKGIARFVSPAITGGYEKVFEYHDPIPDV